MNQPSTRHMRDPLRITVCPRCHRPVPITDDGNVHDPHGRGRHVMTLGGLACHTSPTEPPATGTCAGAGR